MEEKISLTEDEADAARQKLVDMDTMMATMGWRWFVAEINREIEVIKEDLLTIDPEKIPFLQGRADQCLQIVHFEDLVKNYLDMIVEGEGDADL